MTTLKTVLSITPRNHHHHYTVKQAVNDTTDITLYKITTYICADIFTTELTAINTITTSTLQPHSLSVNQTLMTKQPLLPQLSFTEEIMDLPIVNENNAIL